MDHVEKNASICIDETDSAGNVTFPCASLVSFPVLSKSRAFSSEPHATKNCEASDAQPSSNKSANAPRHLYVDSFGRASIRGCAHFLTKDACICIDQDYATTPTPAPFFESTAGRDCCTG